MVFGLPVVYLVNKELWKRQLFPSRRTEATDKSYLTEGTNSILKESMDKYMPLLPVNKHLQKKDGLSEDLNQNEVLKTTKKNQTNKEEGEKKYEMLITNPKSINDLAEKIINKLEDHPSFQKIVNQIVDIKIKERSQVVKKQLSTMKQKMKAQEQYTRRNCLIFHGNENTSHTHTDEIVKKFAWKNLDVELYDTDIDRSHMLKPKSETRNKDKAYLII